MSFPIIRISQTLLPFQRENSTAIQKKNNKLKKPTQKRYSQIKTDMNRYEHIVILVNDFFISLVTFSERYTLMNVIFAICF